MRQGVWSLQEARLLQQPRHLLVLPLPRFPLQTPIPENVAHVRHVVELIQVLVQVIRDELHARKVERLALPLLDLLYHFRRLGALAEVDEVAGDQVRCAVLNEGERRQVYTYNIPDQHPCSRFKVEKSAPMNGTQGGVMRCNNCR